MRVNVCGCVDLVGFFLDGSERVHYAHFMFYFDLV